MNQWNTSTAVGNRSYLRTAFAVKISECKIDHVEPDTCCYHENSNTGVRYRINSVCECNTTIEDDVHKESN